MASTESLSVIVSRRPPLLPFARRDTTHTVVWLGGEQDQCTVADLSETLARVIALDDADVVVDLSEVQFMGAATVGVLLRARVLLWVRSRALVLRSPSRCVRRVLDLCGDADLLDPQPVAPSPVTGPAGALGTWVPVPATERAARCADPAPKPGSAPVPFTVGWVEAVGLSSLDIVHRAEQRTANVASGGGP